MFYTSLIIFKFSKFNFSISSNDSWIFFISLNGPNNTLYFVWDNFFIIGFLKKLPQFPKTIAGLEESSSEWNFKKAAHLLRRTTIGPTYSEITESVKDGLDKTLNKIFLVIGKITKKPNISVKKPGKINNNAAKAIEAPDISS